MSFIPIIFLILKLITDRQPIKPPLNFLWYKKGVENHTF